MGRQDRLIKERGHDPYHSSKKLPAPSSCSECHAVYKNGRWIWAEVPNDAKAVLCPACQRVRDDLPAGVFTLAGEFHRTHREEIMGLLRHVEEREAKSHPMNRIMKIIEHDDEMVVTTSESRLARSLGDAVHHAYSGDLDYHYPDGAGVLRVRWSR